MTIQALARLKSVAAQNLSEEIYKRIRDLGFVENPGWDGVRYPLFISAYKMGAKARAKGFDGKAEYHVYHDDRKGSSYSFGTTIFFNKKKLIDLDVPETKDGGKAVLAGLDKIRAAMMQALGK